MIPLSTPKAAYDVTTTGEPRSCPICGSEDLVFRGANDSRCTCVECEANGIRASREWLWAPGHAVRALHAAYDDADRRDDSK